MVATALLCAQLFLLWLQGSLLNRQHKELASMRSEIRDLALAINDTMFMDEEAYVTPAYGIWPNASARSKQKAGGLLPVNLQEEELAANEVEKSRKSAEDAVKEAKKVQQELSISENARKAEEKAKIEKEKTRWHRYLGYALLGALVAYFGGAWLRKRG